MVRLLARGEPIELCGTGRFNQGTNTDNQASIILKFPDEAIAVVSTADDINMTWQFDVYGTKGVLKVETNPWLPTQDNNKILIKLNNGETSEISVSADKSLYTYQIDHLNTKIKNKEGNHYNTSSLLDSLGNTIVLETWLQQVKSKALLATTA